MRMTIENVRRDNASPAILAILTSNFDKDYRNVLIQTDQSCIFGAHVVAVLLYGHRSAAVVFRKNWLFMDIFRRGGIYTSKLER